jgi:uncharacterized phage protein gp47/JayE
VQAAVTAELEALIDRVANPGGAELLLSAINEAISIASGENDHATVSPVADVTVPFGSMATLGTITFGTLP